MNTTQIAMVKALQDGLPLCEEPFKAVAESIGIGEDALLRQLEEWKADATIRRFGAILRHQRAGYAANAMGVWNVPEDKIEDFGKAASESEAVSHCYQRPRFAGFDYNLYTMIHGKSTEECEAVAAEISQRTGISEYRLLYTTKEFKKTSPVYFASRL